MRIATVLYALGVLVTRSIAQDPTVQDTITQGLATPTPTSFTGPCASIKAAQSSQSTPSDSVKFNAGTAWDCMNSIPINSTDATELVNWAKEYYVFVSTQGWLQNPPPSWQWPAFDFLGGFDEISTTIESNGFTSQLQLDLALINMTRNTHDFHNNLVTGTLGMFTFKTNFSVVSLSLDGNSIPQIFVYEDIMKNGSGPGGLGQNFNPSAIKSLGGQDPVQFLRNFTVSNQELGYLEEHAEWNAQMSNYVLEVAKKSTALASSNFYNGDSLIVEFENGSLYTSDIWATAEFNFSSSDSLQDIYSSFVLDGTATTTTPSSTATSFPDPPATDGFEGASPVTAASSAPEAEDTRLPFPDPQQSKYMDEAELLTEPLKFLKGPYPLDSVNPVVVQEDLGNTGFVTGYHLVEQDLAILSLPSFSTPSSSNVTDAAVKYSTAVGSFIDKSTEKGLRRLVIDVQTNGGGLIFLGYEIFKRLFPSITPYGGWTLRATPQMNAICTEYTAAVTNPSLSQSAPLYVPFNAHGELSDNGTMYSTWSQAQGPILNRGDNFTNTIQFNCSNDDVMSPLGGNVFTGLFGYGSRPATNTTPPWDPENIVLLTDGTCGSTCAIFSEFLKTEVGVRRVVMGGIPSAGPMQAVSGSRGSQTYSLGTILETANIGRQYFPDSPETQNLPKIDAAPRISVHKTGSLNIKNMVRRGSDVPLQFAYEAADCRLWYTPEMMTNYSVLWTTAAKAILDDPSLCVQGSTNHSTAAPNVTSLDAPDSSSTSGTTTSSSAPSDTAAAPSATSSKSVAAAGAIAQGAFVAFIALLASAVGFW